MLIYFKIKHCYFFKYNLYLSHSVARWLPNTFLPSMRCTAKHLSTFIHGDDQLLSTTISLSQDTIFCRLTTTTSQCNVPIEDQGNMHKENALQQEIFPICIHFLMFRSFGFIIFCENPLSLKTNKMSQ